MRVFPILTLSLAVLSVVAPEATAQNVLHFYELGVEVNGSRVNLAISDAATGQSLYSGLITETGASPDIQFDTNGQGGPGIIYLPPGLLVLSFTPASCAGVPNCTPLSAPIKYAWAGNPTPITLGSFYRPASSGAIDTDFKLVSGKLNVHSNDSSIAGDINTFLGATGWTLPYDRTALCALTTCNGNGPTGQFFSAGVQTQAPLPGYTGLRLVPTFAFKGTVAPPSAWGALTWNVPNLQLRFTTGAQLYLTTSTSLNITGATLTQDVVKSDGWYGIYVPGGNLTLGAGTTVELVYDPNQSSFSPQGAVSAVTIANGGQATIDGATIQNTETGAGVVVTGTNSTAHVSASSGTTRIQGTTNGAAVIATAGGHVIIDGDAVEITNNASGLVSTGTGSSILVTGALVQNNLGPAVRASGGGHVDILRYTGYTAPTTLNMPVRLDNNTGGLYAVALGKTGGGVVNTGEHVYECDPSGCANPAVGQHNFTYNNLGPAFDITSRGGSIVLAPENYWSTTSASAVERDFDSQSYIDYLPILTAPASLTSGPVASRGVAGDANASLAMLDEETGAARMSLGVLALLGEAEARTQGGDATEAGARILAAWALSNSDDDRTAVAEAAGRTLAALEPAALVAWTDGAGAWGARARAAGLIGQARYAEAAAAAGALAAETGTDETALGHRARGLSLLVEAAVGAHDASAAVSSLTDLAEIDEDGAADLALSVAVAFPDAPITLGRGTPNSGENSSVGKATPGASSLTLAAGPNPSSGTVRVSLTLAESSEATVSVFDALGRQVALLHEGAAIGTVEAMFDGRTFPAGVYVVRAVVHSAGGASVLTRTVTVAR